MSERKSPYSLSTSTIWNFSGAMISLPSRASNSSELCGTFGGYGDLLGHLLEEAVGRFLIVYFEALATRLPVLRQAEGEARRLADRAPFHDPQAHRTVLADGATGIVVGPPRRDPHDVEVEGAAEVGRHAGDRVDRPVDHREAEPAPEDRVRALLGSHRRMLQRHHGRLDRLGSPVINRRTTCLRFWRLKFDAWKSRRIGSASASV